MVQSSAICRAYFECVDEINGKWKCKCCENKILTQKPKTGWSNLISHVKSQHQDYETLVEAEEKTGQKLIGFLFDKESTNIYGWLDILVNSFCPINLVNDKNFIRQSKLHETDFTALAKYLELLTTEVVDEVKKALPSTIGLIIDEWFDDVNTYYVSLFAIFEGGKYMLASLPMEKDLYMDANEKLNFIVFSLYWYGLTLENVNFIIAENSEQNISISKSAEAPLIGCSIARLNVAIEEILKKKYEKEITKIDQIFQTLRKISNSSRLHEFIKIKPYMRENKKWLGVLNLISCYMDYKNILSENWDLFEIDQKLKISPVENDKIIELNKMLTFFHQASMQLRVETCTIADSRIIFDLIIKDYPDMGEILGKNSKLIENPLVENGIMKLQNNEDLLNEEKEALKKINKSGTVKNDSESGKVASDNPFAVALKRRRIDTDDYDYGDFSHIKPCSKLMEPMFDNNRLYFTELRRALTSDHFQMFLVLKLNPSLWNVQSVAKLKAQAHLDLAESVKEMKDSAGL